MDHRGNLLRTLRRQGYERVPCDIEFTPPKEEEFFRKVKGQTAAEYYGLSHRGSHRIYTPGYEGDGKQLFSHLDLPERFDVDEFGVGQSYGSKEAFHMCHFHSPLEGETTTLQQIEEFALPALNKDQEAVWQAFVADCHARQLAAFGWLEQTIWERAWLIRGMNDLMMDMMMEEEKAVRLLDRITDHAIEAAVLFARTGHDIIALGDDVGMQHTVMMSPDLWRTWLKPRLTRVVDAIRAVRKDTLIFYHSCGYVEPFIPDLIEIGIDILNPIQPECMDIEKIHREYGRDLSFWGGIGTQTTFPFGSPEDVRASVRELVRIAGEKGGIVVGPTHVLEPEVPWENQEAMRDELRLINREISGL